MKICLVIPPSSFLLDDRVFPTLGILKVGAMLEQSGMNPLVLDLSGVKNYEQVTEFFATSHPEIECYALTSTTPQLPPVMKIVRVLRRLAPRAKLILGGPHVTLVNAAYKRDQKIGRTGRAETPYLQLVQTFDVIVAGDGELAIFDALKETSPKVIDADKAGSDLFLTNQSFTELPWPNRALVDILSYKYTIDGIPATSLIAQLGCPFACGFCGGRNSDAFRKIRNRSPESVVEEMTHLFTTYGYRGFMLYDDELNVKPETLVTTMRLISKRQRELGTEWRLRGFLKSQLVTTEQAEVMYEAGFRWVLVGFESGAERILTNINKKATKAENTACIEILKRAGLKVKALMSIGHPGESPQTIKETRDWLIETKPADFDATIITCYPGTPYYDQALPQGRPGHWRYTYGPTGDNLYQIEVDFTQVAEYYKGDINKGYKAFVYTDTLSAEDLVAARDELETSVRSELGIPFNKGAPEIVFEHSMGQQLPQYILRTRLAKEEVASAAA